MKILTALVAFNRVEYTRRAFTAWLKTAGENSRLIVVDNGSTDGTVEWLSSRFAMTDDLMIFENGKNLFPGAATNIGWHHGNRGFNADLLMRLDNDVELLPGWRRWVERTFKAMPMLGQLGILNAHEDYPDGQPWERFEKNGCEVFLGNAGGPSIIRRELWDKGLRWIPGGWRPGGQDEDTQMSEQVRSLGYMVGKIVPTIANNMSFHRFDEYPDYYRATAALRGLPAETSV